MALVATDVGLSCITMGTILTLSFLSTISIAHWSPEVETQRFVTHIHVLA